MIITMKTVPIVILGCCLSVGLFIFSYVFFDEIAEASTGYNATERGLFAWTYSYAEHEFVDDGDGFVQAVLISSGDDLRYGRLALEIVTSVAVGFPLALIVVCFLSAMRTESGEQAGAAQPTAAVDLKSK